jgi:hypothetical protein
VWDRFPLTPALPWGEGESFAALEESHGSGIIHACLVSDPILAASVTITPAPPEPVASHFLSLGRGWPKAR